ncbi:MAG: GspH/FimT family pseudopilin [Ramlibacter sp.]
MKNVGSGAGGAAGGASRRSLSAEVAGVTLVEVLVVMALLALLAAIGMSSMSRLVDSTRLTAYANDFLSAMYLARSEAIKRRGRAALCKSSDGASCANSGGWDQGWIVFRDTNNNGMRDAGEVVVHYTSELPAGFRFSGNSTVAAYISYVPSGRTRLTGGGFQAGRLTLCKLPSGGLEGRQIVINNAGRARINRVSGDACP